MTIIKTYAKVIFYAKNLLIISLLCGFFYHYSIPSSSNLFFYRSLPSFMMEISVILIPFISILFILVQKSFSDCVWYGEIKVGKGIFNLANNGPAQPLNNKKAIEQLKEFCPVFYHEVANGAKPPELCCDATQVESLTSKSSILKNMLNGCDQCTTNIATQLCDLTCSPKQKSYMTTEIKESDAGTEYVSAVKEIAYSKTTMQDIYDSCALLLKDNLQVKNRQSYLNFLGDPMINSAIPFLINYTLYDQAPAGRELVTRDVYKCYEEMKLPGSDIIYPSCNPSYCKGNIARAPPQLSPEMCEVSGFPCIAIVMAIVYSVTLIGAIVAIGCCHKVLSRSSDNGLMKTGAEARLELESPDDLNGLSSDDEVATSILRFDYLEKAGAQMSAWMRIRFAEWGYYCACHPVLVTTTSILICIALSAGLTKGLEPLTDPVELWSAPSSQARVEKDYFDKHFGGFHRIAQIIISPKDPSPQPISADIGNGKSFTYSPMLSYAQSLAYVSMIVSGIQKIRASTEDGRAVSLDDICLKPLQSECAIYSPSQYFQESKEPLRKILAVTTNKKPAVADACLARHILDCAANPMIPEHSVRCMNEDIQLSCFGQYGGPEFPYLVLGGYPLSDDPDAEPAYHEASAAVVTIPIRSDKNNASYTELAEAWELAFIKFMQHGAANWTSVNAKLKFSFTSERSIQDEIQRESKMNLLTVILSYLVMLVYVSLALGEFDCGMTIIGTLIQAKILVGLGGVLIVALSVTASLGLFSYTGIAPTLIILEVVPFLVLAVGIDNIFILVQCFQRHRRRLSTTEASRDPNIVMRLIGESVGEIGPSMLLTSLSESVAFFFGAFSVMPAVYIFSLYAGMAVLVNFGLQMSAFVALLAIDAKRVQARRPDIFCCFVASPASAGEDRTPSGSLLYRFFKSVWSPFILATPTRIVAILVFIGMSCVSISLAPMVSIGLDQQVTMPHDSYVLAWMKDMTKYFRAGPPVYFVVKDGYDYESVATQNLICSDTRCSGDSLVNQLAAAARYPDVTRMAHPPYDWLTSYFQWTNPKSACCHVEDRTTRKYCDSNTQNGRSQCFDKCFNNNTYDSTLNRPRKADFSRFLEPFFGDNPDARCPFGGQALYDSAVERSESGRVEASNFMGYHSLLRTSKDYTDALRYSRFYAENITKTLNGKGEVFAYSVFYVFYEQYLTIVYSTVTNLIACLAAIAVVTFVLLGLSVHSALMVIITVAMIIINMFGAMYLCGIQLNAISLVNLVMSVGIAVEFSSHIVRHFVDDVGSGGKQARAQRALTEIGSSVCSGIMFTKLVGIAVLDMATSELFRIYYFRMLLAIIVLGSAHGLIFLPCMLSFIGPAPNRFAAPPDSTLFLSEFIKNNDEDDDLHKAPTTVKMLDDTPASRASPSSSQSEENSAPTARIDALKHDETDMDKVESTGSGDFHIRKIPNGVHSPRSPRSNEESEALLPSPHRKISSGDEEEASSEKKSIRSNPRSPPPNFRTPQSHRSVET